MCLIVCSVCSLKGHQQQQQEQQELTDVCRDRAATRHMEDTQAEEKKEGKSTKDTIALLIDPRLQQHLTRYPEEEGERKLAIK